MNKYGKKINTIIRGVINHASRIIIRKKKYFQHSFRYLWEIHLPMNFFVYTEFVVPL